MMQKGGDQLNRNHFLEMIIYTTNMVMKMKIVNQEKLYNRESHNYDIDGEMIR